MADAAKIECARAALAFVAVNLIHGAPIPLHSGKMRSIGPILSSPVIADGAVYFGGTHGNLYAIMQLGTR